MRLDLACLCGHTAILRIALRRARTQTRPYRNPPDCVASHNPEDCDTPASSGTP